LIEPEELVNFFIHLDQKITKQQAADKIRAWTKNKNALGLTRTQFVAVFTADADKHELATRQQQNNAIAWTDAFLTVSKALSAVGELMFAIHAPVSAAAFEWFWFVQLGDEYVLRVDPTILRDDDRWTAMLPVALFVLFVLTLGLPLFMSGWLWYHRKELDGVASLSRFGWSYDRYNAGVEWWGIHEILRKAILTGLLIYIPSVSLRVCVALIVSIFAVVNLN
jgi:hypothetical protein